MENLRPCPFCGSNARKVNLLFWDETKSDGASCSNKKCPLYQPFHLQDWQSRPLEDALRAERDRWKHAYEAEEKLRIQNMKREDALRAKLEECDRQRRELYASELDGKVQIEYLSVKLEEAKKLLNRLSHWDMLWLGAGQPSLVSDGPYWKHEIDEALKKLN